MDSKQANYAIMHNTRGEEEGEEFSPKSSTHSRSSYPEKKKDTYFIFKSFRMSHQSMIRCTTAALLLSIFTERYCFIVTVYKMKFYGYVLILIVIALNCIFNLILSRLRFEKKTKALHQLFSIDRTPSMGSCIIGVIG